MIIMKPGRNQIIYRSVLLLALILLIQSCSIFQKNDKVTEFYYYDNNQKIFPKNITVISRLADDKLAIASPDDLFIIDNGNLLAQYRISNVTSVVEYKGEFYIGTINGLFKGKDNNQIVNIEIPALTTKPKISSILNVDDQMWIGTEGVGIYKYDGSIMKPVPSTPVINCLAQTSDKSIWAGSNSGLFRFFQDGSSVRYSEEIPHEGIAILDNDVRHLQIDSHSNLWVFMTNAVSIFTPDQFVTKSSDHVDPLTFDYIGDDKNSMIKVYDFKDRKDKLVLSEKGLYILSDLDVTDSHNHEESSDQKTVGNMKKLEYLKLEDGSVISIERALDCSFDHNFNLLISTMTGVYKIPNSIIKKL